MADKRLQRYDLDALETPYFLVDLGLIEEDLKVLDKVQKDAGCKIMLALKGFAMWQTFPLISKYLAGVCASGLDEAKLGREKFGKEVHTYSPAFKVSEFDLIMDYSDYIVFNSIAQREKFRLAVERNRKRINLGMRVNPEIISSGMRYSAYNPCCDNSRLGVLKKELEENEDSLEGITGLHFHALCQQNADALEEVLFEFEGKFSKYIDEMKWINFGGGHHITREDYDTDKLCRLIRAFKKSHKNLEQVYMEPGEAVVLNAGYLVSTVIDIIHRKKDIAILDISAECHLPDVLITRHDHAPWVPTVVGAKAGSNVSPEYPHSYILGGVSCAAGDYIAEYSFKEELKPGDKVIFEDTAHYTMVKTSTFNGVRLPAIAVFDPAVNEIIPVKRFTYLDYESRLS
jgi:carboxynorspermidine decarboxylase